MGEENEQIEWLTPKVEARASYEDSMTLAKFSQIVRTSSSPKVSADHAQSSTSCKRKIPSVDTDDAKLSALKEAEVVQASLDPAFPSFVKSMVASHVASGYWLGLPAQFCNSYLQNQGDTITLVDENGEEYPTRLIFEKTGLSAGWKKFSADHKLVVGDALVFQLLEPTKLKVHIIRAYSCAEVDVVHGLLDLDTRGKRSDPGKHTEITKRSRRKSRKSLQQSVIKGNNQNSILPTLPGSNFGVLPGQTGNDSEEVDSEVLQGTGISGSIVEFKDMGNLESFTIKVNDLIIDSEISGYVRTKYYELCCSQKTSLHENILKGMNSKLVAGIISETVNVADAIIASKPTTPQDDFATWDKSLIAFEQLGMNVGFLRSKLQRLVSLAYESEQALELQRYKEAILGQDGIQVEICSAEAKLVELKEASKRLEAEVKTLKVKAERHELNLLDEAKAPW